MATLKDHQQAMVDLLASGSGIPASASRLAHAMHDVLEAMLTGVEIDRDKAVAIVKMANDATTPGLNDKALAGDIEACRPKATPVERRVKELENTVKQLRASNAKLREDLACQVNNRDMYKMRCESMESEQAGCCKDDTQDACGCKGSATYCADGITLLCDRCGKEIPE